MTIEEKAIAYDKAIERAKRMFSKKELNYLFPELKETGDEKVRKWLIDTIKSVPDYSIEWDVIDKSDVLAWLEKQGEQKPSDKIKPKFKVGDKIYLKPKYRMPNDDTPIANTVKEIIGIDDDFYRFKGAYIFIEDQDKYELVEQKPIDKVAPKFKVGDWCIDNEDGTIFQIVKVLYNTYTYKTNEGKEYSCTHYSLENDARLWTIDDAKPGDMLATSSGPFIYNGNKGGGSCPGSLCGINTLGEFKIGVESHWTGKKVYPATKEQCDILMKAMADAGYTFDFENKELKELKKIEFNPDDLIEESYQQQADDLIDMVTEKPAEWSEEDEEMVDKIIDYIKPMPIFFESTKGKSGKEYTKEFVKNVIKWLKSLKNRVAPQKQWKQKGETLSGWWVARDKNGELYVYNVKPERNVLSWEVTNGTYIGLSQKLFPDLKWEDEPIEVDVIIKPKTT